MVDREKALELHSRNPGKISVETSVEIETAEDLDLVYTPGVAEPCKVISEEKEKAYSYTSKGNLVAVVSDGSAVLGLGDIGPEASMPVMEGKCNFFKSFGDVDAFPICLDTDETSEIIETVTRIAPTLGGVNLEDIKAPECFEIEERLKEQLDIPVFHDDQHGTAIVVLAALRNALDLLDKELESSRVVVLGAGAAGIAVSKFLIDAGAGSVIPVDSGGILGTEDGNKYKRELASQSSASEESGELEDALEDADALIGLSTGGIVSKEMVKKMADDPVIFALANPEPEIFPEDARDAGAEIVATGRSDFPNQVNNSLAFPGIFKGALEVRSSSINHEMKIAASEAIRKFLDPEKGRIVPDTLDKKLAESVAKNVKEAAKISGVSRL